MNILGYETGPITCQAAFIADFDVGREIPMAQLVSKIDIDRRTMATRPGMRSKYVPLRFDPATGAHQIGGRYLFDTWEDVTNYMRFTVEELEFEPGVKFWERPFFSNIDKRAWHVIGAHEFMPLAMHCASRLERYGYSVEPPTRKLEAAWPALRDAAQEEGLAAIWLLLQPDEQQIGLLTVAAQLPGEDEADRASRSLAALEQRASLIRHLSGEVVTRSLFDRSSLNLSLWLPRSQPLGGDASAFSTYPVHPLPEPDPEAVRVDVR